MANPEITNVDLGRCVLEAWDFSDELLVFGGADTFVEGTILARRKVGLTPTIGDITRAGTSDGTVTAAAVVGGSKVPKVGDYVLTCIEAIANGGVWKLVDPDGELVAPYLPMTVGAGAVTTFEVDGLSFVVTDGANDFEVGDTVDITVAADGKMVPFATDGAGGAQFPLAVLPHESVRTGAGNNAIRALRAGRVNKNRLVIDADGDASNVTAAILDALRAAGIMTDDVKQLSELDNQ